MSASEHNYLKFKIMEKVHWQTKDPSPTDSFCISDCFLGGKCDFQNVYFFKNRVIKGASDIKQLFRDMLML